MSTVFPPLILHIPHSSRDIPYEVQSELLLSEEAVERQLDLLTDHYTDQLFSASSAFAQTVMFPISRFVVDPERFEDDVAEPMAACGMGVIYTRTTDGEAFRSYPSTMQREQLLRTYYHPHHESLTTAVKNALDMHGKALVVDCHSFPESPLPCDLSQQPFRPDFCIGTDPFHTPDGLVADIKTYLEQNGFSVKVNDPYAGTIVPLDHYGTDQRVLSMMIEVNRRIYLTNPSSDRIKSDRFEQVQSLLAKVLELSHHYICKNTD